MSDDHANDPRRLLLLGGGDHAAVVADAADGAGWIVAGFLDDAGGDGLSVASGEVPRLGVIADLPRVHETLAGCAVHAATGSTPLRRRWLDATGRRPIATVIHRSAVVSALARIEEGSFVGPGAVVNARARIGRGIIVNTNAVIEHDCVIDAFSHVAPGAVLAGRVAVGQACLVGAGAVVIEGCRLGDGVTLGAGAVAVTDVPAGATALGVPARWRQ